MEAGDAAVAATGWSAVARAGARQPCGVAAMARTPPAGAVGCRRPVARQRGAGSARCRCAPAGVGTCSAPALTPATPLASVNSSLDKGLFCWAVAARYGVQRCALPVSQVSSLGGRGVVIGWKALKARPPCDQRSRTSKSPVISATFLTLVRVMATRISFSSRFSRLVTPAPPWAARA